MLQTVDDYIESAEFVDLKSIDKLFFLAYFSKDSQTKSMFSWEMHLQTSCDCFCTGITQGGLSSKNLLRPTVLLG